MFIMLTLLILAFWLVTPLVAGGLGVNFMVDGLSTWREDTGKALGLILLGLVAFAIALGVFIAPIGQWAGWWNITGS